MARVLRRLLFIGKFSVALPTVHQLSPKNFHRHLQPHQSRHKAKQFAPGALMILPVIRCWLPPICLVVLMAAVWALPYRPDCESLARGNDPAIARVDGQCILLSHYADWLYVIEAAMEHHTEHGSIANDLAVSDYQRRWYDRVNFYGPETIALADAVRVSILYQRAVSDGHAPSQEEVSARLDQDRLRSETFHDLINLAKLAEIGTVPDSWSWREKLGTLTSGGHWKT